MPFKLAASMLRRAGGRTTTNTFGSSSVLFGNSNTQFRCMSMMLWRHVPIYQKPLDSSGKRQSRKWRLNKYQKKPAKPVRVDGFRAAAVDFKHGVITPDGTVRPWHGKYKQHLFLDFWREWVEKWQQMRDYEEARGIPRSAHCPRCDNPLHWLGRAPADVIWKDIESPLKPKRRMYDRVENEPGAVEDRYCCPDDDCGIREARLKFKQNVVLVDIIEGLTDKQWAPTRFGAGRKGREKSEKARAKLEETPFDNRGVRIGVHNQNAKAPYLNQVTHEQAVKIMEQKAKARDNIRYNRIGIPQFHTKPDWYKPENNFIYSSPRAQKRLEKEQQLERKKDLMDASWRQKNMARNENRNHNQPIDYERIRNQQIIDKESSNTVARERILRKLKKKALERNYEAKEPQSWREESKRILTEKENERKSVWDRLRQLTTEKETKLQY